MIRCFKYKDASDTELEIDYIDHKVISLKPIKDDEWKFRWNFGYNDFSKAIELGLLKVLGDEE